MSNWFLRDRGESKQLDVNSVEVLKGIWGIPATPAKREAPPKEVVTDIYHTASSARPVPRRRSPRPR